MPELETFSPRDYAGKLKPSSARVVYYNLLLFLRFAMNQPDAEDADALYLPYVESCRNGTLSPFKAIRDFIEAEKKAGKAPKTIQVKLSEIMKWHQWNGIVCTPQESAILKSCMPRSVLVTEDEEISKEQIKSIISHTDILTKAILLIAASSGARINEILSLSPEDLIDEAPYRFHISKDRMKAGRAHTYFYSEEAHAALMEWMKRRDTYLQQTQILISACLKKSRGESARIFPISYGSIRERLNRAVEAAQFSRKDDAGRRTIHLHSFRKFCDSEMKRHISSNLANALIGHFEAGDASYRRYPKERLIEAYRKCEPYLTIEAPADYAELHTITQERIAETNATVSAMAHKIATLEAEISSLVGLFNSM